MVKVVGPMMSLEATGNFAKTVNFFYGPSGAVVRLKKRIFIPPGQIWYLNQVAFKAAGARWKSFSKVQQNAWTMSFFTICDTGRDLFMGKQIEFWNMHPDNDLSWPEKYVPDFPWPQGRSFTNSDIFTVSFSLVMSGELPSLWKTPGFRWYASESQTALVNPVFLGETVPPRITIRQVLMPTPYCWASAVRSNGVVDPAKFVSVW